jgi:hypothetical protein
MTKASKRDSKVVDKGVTTGLTKEWELDGKGVAKV